VKILLVGGGGREHALAWKIAQSSLVEQLWAAPGNPGIARHARCLDIAVDDADGLAGFAKGHDADLVVVGPEQPLVAGLADRLRAKGLAVFGPSERAAAIEGSKAYAKCLMAEHGVPTARFATFDDAAAARRYCRERGVPCVVKADGLAAGKGAIVCATLDEADAAIAQCLERREFGTAGTRVVVEEFMQGEEVSLFVLAGAGGVFPLAAAQDHKTVFDGDRGPNTGGMGAFAPSPLVDAELQARVQREIVDPVVRGMRQEGHEYRGFLYAGLMLTCDGPKVIEFNVRFGDPEAQVVLPLIEGDLPGLLTAAADGDIGAKTVTLGEEVAVGVVLASAGYPGVVTTGAIIAGLERAAEVTGVTVLHAATVLRDNQFATSGGRVLTVVGRAKSFERAIAAAYEGVSHISFDGMQFRSDIGQKARPVPVT